MNTIALEKVLSDGRRNYVAHYDRNRIAPLIHLSFFCLVAAACLYFTQGYHVGFHSINSLANVFPEKLLQTITFMGDGAVCISAGILFARRCPALVWVLFLAMLGGTLVLHLGKDSFGMMRPPAVLESDSVNVIGKAFRNGSFPSGHTFTAFVVGAIWFYFAKTYLEKWLALFAASIVGISRVVVGAHWPIDVLVGAALGMLSVAISLAVASRFYWGKRRFGHLFILTLLLIAVVVMMTEQHGYPLAREFALVFGTICLTIFLTEYLPLITHNIQVIRSNERFKYFSGFKSHHTQTNHKHGSVSNIGSTRAK